MPVTQALSSAAKRGARGSRSDLHGGTQVRAADVADAWQTVVLSTERKMQWATADTGDNRYPFLNAPSASSCMSVRTPVANVGPPPGTAADSMASSSSRLVAPC